MAADLHRWTYEALYGHHNLESLLTMKEQLFVTTTPTPLSANLSSSTLLSTKVVLCYVGCNVLFVR